MFCPIMVSSWLYKYLITNSEAIIGVHVRFFCFVIFHAAHLRDIGLLLYSTIFFKGADDIDLPLSK